MSAEMHPIVSDELWKSLLAQWHKEDAPRGWRVEILEGSVTVTPPPGNEHNGIADVLHSTLARVIPAGVGLYQTLGVSVPHRHGLFIPDLVAFRRADVRSRPDTEAVPAEKAMLVAEITSQYNANRDRHTKLWGYAHAGVPRYLLIDRFDLDGPTVTLFSDPAGGDYQQALRVPFGESVKLGAPFDVELNTGDF